MKKQKTRRKRKERASGWKGPGVKNTAQTSRALDLSSVCLYLSLLLLLRRITSSLSLSLPLPLVNTFLLPSSIYRSSFINQLLLGFFYCSSFLAEFISWLLFPAFSFRVIFYQFPFISAIAPTPCTVRDNSFPSPGQLTAISLDLFTPSQPLPWPSPFLYPDTVDCFDLQTLPLLANPFCLIKMAEIRRKLVIVGDGACGKTCLLM